MLDQAARLAKLGRMARMAKIMRMVRIKRLLAKLQYAMGLKNGPPAPVPTRRPRGTLESGHETGQGGTELSVAIGAHRRAGLHLQYIH